MEVTYSQGKSTLRIIVRNEEVSRGAKMIKPKVESNKGEWFLNKYCKGKQLEPQLVRLTKTQKRRI